MENIAIAGISLTAILGIAAFVVSVVVEMTKDVGVIKRIPTKLWCMIISLICCVSFYFIYTAVTHNTTYWYYIVATVIGSLVVSYIATYGWDTLKELYSRFTNV